MAVQPRTTHNLTRQIEDDIRDAIPFRRNPTVGPLAPTPAPTVDDVGRLSGEALAMSYEAAAKQIEEMSNQLLEEVRSCERGALEVVKELDRVREKTLAAVDQCKESAAAFRAEAEVLLKHVQSRCAVADDVRKLCGDMITRIRMGD